MATKRTHTTTLITRRRQAELRRCHDCQRQSFQVLGVERGALRVFSFHTDEYAAREALRTLPAGALGRVAGAA